jgi:PKD repeat protein
VDPDGSIVQYVWDFGDGTTGFGSTVLHTFSAGIFSVKLTIIDNGGASASSTISVGVVNQVPKAVASASPDSGLSPLSLAFSALGSSDFDGSIVKYIWDFGDGTSGSGSNLTHTFVTSGFYFATLVVTDESGATAKTQVGVLVGKTFTPQSSQLKLNFKRDGNDKFTLSTKSLPCDPALNAAGLSGEIRIGTLVYGFTLDAKGKYKAAPLTIQFVPSKRSFKVTLNQASLAGTVASLGARDDTLKNSPVVIPFALSFSDGSVYGFTRLIYNYSSKRGVSGTASFRP